MAKNASKIEVFHTESRRPSKDHYYLEIAEAVAQRGTCLSICFGAIIVKDDQIISTGYVGAPRKTKDCMELGYCIRRQKNVPSGTGYEMCRSVHSEMNAIINAARAGVSLLGGDMYLHCTKREADNSLKLVKAYPCLMCKKMIINAGVRRFIGHDENGNIEDYLINDWVNDWQILEDISADKDQYKVKYSKADLEKNKKSKK